MKKIFTLLFCLSTFFAVTAQEQTPQETARGFMRTGDFDNAILNWILETFKKEQGIDLHNDKMALQRLRDAAEKAKIELSGTMTTEINHAIKAAV